MITSPKLSILYKSQNIADPFFKKDYLPIDKELNWANIPYHHFKKYRHLVTWFVNTPQGREFLDLPQFNENIGLLVPNGYHKILGSNAKEFEAEAVFYSRDIIAQRLNPILNKFDRYFPFMLNFTHAQETFLYFAGYQKDIPHIVRYANLVVDQFYPDPHTESTSVDGLVFRHDVDETWATIRGGAGTGAIDDSASTTYVGWSTSGTSNQFAVIRRAIFLFDTSSLPDANTISASTLSVFGTNKQDTNSDTPALALVASNPASNTALVGADYSTLGTTRFAPDISYASYSTSAYNTFSLNASGLAAITKTGVSKFGLRSDNDLDNAAPTWSASAEPGIIQGYYADQAATTNDPKLEVTHNTTTSTSTTTTTSTSTSTSTTITTTSTSTTTTTSTSTSTSTTQTSTSTTLAYHFKIEGEDVDPTMKIQVDHGDLYHV